MNESCGDLHDDQWSATTEIYRGTHDDTATKVLCKVEDTLRYTGIQPLRPLGQNREESAGKRADEDDEDRSYPDTEELIGATTITTVKISIVATVEMSSSTHCR